MRVTGGEWRGLILDAPKGPPIRTTLDHVRQAIFNLVGDKVTGASVLDLFAGSGALGIEALSRGAAQVTFVDRSFFCVQAIETNLKSVSDTRCTVIRAEAMSAIRRFARDGARFDLVLLDPPYGGKLLIKSLNALCQYAIVSPAPLGHGLTGQAGWIVAECDRRSHLPPQIQGKEAKFLLQRHKQYGDTVLGVYETVGG